MPQCNELIAHTKTSNEAARFTTCGLVTATHNDGVYTGGIRRFKLRLAALSGALYSLFRLLEGSIMTFPHSKKPSRILKNSRSALGVAALLSSAFAFHSSPAQACGGLFCSAANPVNQAAERIIFAQNADETITAAVEILYEGPAERFAWVLPVPAGEIEVAVSSKDAFDALDRATNPQYNLQLSFDDGCLPPNRVIPTAVPAVAPPASAVSSVGDKRATVQVVASGNAGPYDWEQIMVVEGLEEPAQVAIDWLEDNGYDVGALGPDVLRPYLEAGNNLVAFRLDKESDSGSIRPVMLTYAGTTPVVPIRPTAIAANEDMGIKVWVLGPSRAIPENYLHLELNEAAINWFNPNDNYNEVIIAAANEAENGQGFVTEHAGPASEFTQNIYPRSVEATWDALKSAQFKTTLDFLESAARGLGSLDGFSDVMSNPEVLPLRQGATVEQFMNCMSCYFETEVAVRNDAYPSTEFNPETDPLLTMDIPAFLAEVEELVIAPLEDTVALFENNSTVTRFYTTMSPDEMMVDPFFNFNPELEEISNIHRADQIMQCSEDETDWRIELPQGIILKGNGREWPVTEQDDFPMTYRILQLAPSGSGTEWDNNTARIRDLLSDLGIGEAGPELEEAARRAEENPAAPMMDPTAPEAPSAAPEQPTQVDSQVAEDPQTGRIVAIDLMPVEPAIDAEGEPMEGSLENGIEMALPGEEIASGGAGCSVGQANRRSDNALSWLSIAGLGLLLARRKRS